MILCFNTFQIACPDRTTRPCGNSQRDIPMFGHICVIRHSAEWIFNLLLHLFYGWRVICTRPSINCIHLLNTPSQLPPCEVWMMLGAKHTPCAKRGDQYQIAIGCNVLQCDWCPIDWHPRMLCNLFSCSMLFAHRMAIVAARKVSAALILESTFCVSCLWMEFFNIIVLVHVLKWRCNALGTSVFIMLNAHAACQEYCA